MNCRMCNSQNLTELVSYKNYPIFIGCSDNKIDKDELYNFVISFCEECNIIQQVNIPPLEILYKEQRAFGIGKIWSDHYDNFFHFMKKDFSNEKSIAEVGGGNGLILKMVQDYVPNAHLSDIEPHPYYNLSGINTIKTFFDKNFNYDGKFDVIYSSHLVEHLVDLKYFFEKSNDFLHNDGTLYMATPNIEKSFENLHLNAFTTDHLNYYTPYTIGRLSEKYGLHLADYYQYKDHGMYLKFKKSDNLSLLSLNKVDLKEKFYAYEEKIGKFIKKIEEEVGQSFYLFGASAFSITFVRHLPSKMINNIKYVLDNEKTKTDRRLSGTSLVVKTPDIINKDIKPVVIIYMGAYATEIIQQLRLINSNVVIYNLMDEKHEEN